MTRVHVWGAAGYAAAETIRILSKHPRVELGVLESASHAGEPLAKHFPHLRGSGLQFSAPGSVLAAIRDGDLVIMGGAHGTALEHAPRFVAAGAPVIDLSADFRTLRPTDIEKLHAAGIPAPSIAYGLPERYRKKIAGAQLVANPGCYPTASLLAMLPAVEKFPVQHIVIDAKSGITGAGRTPSVSSLFAEVYGDVRAYGLAGHRHEPEIAQELRTAGANVPFIFTPHVVPIAQGMLADVYLIGDAFPGDIAVHALYADAYAGNPFVRVLPAEQAPSIPAVVGTNNAEIHISVRGNVLRAVCAIDNLGKGAAGQAVQNLNIMCGFPEETGLK